MSIKVKETFFGKLKDGSHVYQYTISNRNGMTVSVRVYLLILLIHLYSKLSVNSIH